MCRLGYARVEHRVTRRAVHSRIAARAAFLLVACSAVATGVWLHQRGDGAQRVTGATVHGVVATDVREAAEGIEAVIDTGRSVFMIDLDRTVPDDTRGWHPPIDVLPAAGLDDGFTTQLQSRVPWFGLL
jgi:hypothetical protein